MGKEDGPPAAVVVPGSANYASPVRCVEWPIEDASFHLS